MQMDGITPTWTAPEVLSKQSYSTEADVYALGILMWELLTRRHPFDHVDLPPFEAIAMPLLSTLIQQGGRPDLPPEAAAQLDSIARSEYIELVTACWDANPDDRPTHLAGLSTPLTSSGQHAAPQVCSDVWLHQELLFCTRRCTAQSSSGRRCNKRVCLLCVEGGRYSSCRLQR